MDVKHEHSLQKRKTIYRQQRMWFYRRLRQISYSKHITNTEVLNRVQQDRQLLNMIGKRQLKFLGHVIRKNNLEDLSLSGRFEGKRPRDRQRITYSIWTILKM